MKYHPSEPRPYRRRGKLYIGRWEIDIRGVLDNGLVVERERRVFPVHPSAGKIGKRQAAAQALEEFERWNRHGQVLRPGETPVLARTGAMKAGTSPTVSQFAKDYLEYCASPNASRRGANSSSTLSGKETNLRVHLVPYFGGMRLDQIERREIDNYIISKSKEGRSTSSVRIDVGILRQMITLAHEHGLIEQPRHIKLPARQDREIDALDPDEADRFLAAASELWIRDSTILTLYLRTGLRLGEALALRPCDLDLDVERPTVTVSRSYNKDGEFGQTKGRKTRVVPLPDVVPAMLDSLMQARGLSPRSETTYLFTNRRGVEHPIGHSWVKRLVPRTGATAKLRHVHPHMLRHTFGTDCARRGVPLLTIKEWMGHVDVEVTMGYVHLAAPDHLRWAKLLDR
jgi:integrase